MESILKQTTELSAEEKIRLADRLYEQVANSSEIEASWRIELDRRAALSASGRMNSITIAEFRDKHRERIERHRQRTA